MKPRPRESGALLRAQWSAASSCKCFTTKPFGPSGPAATATGFTTTYEELPLNPAARNTLKPGKNIIAVHCRQTRGGQYIDVGLVDVIPGN